MPTTNYIWDEQNYLAETDQNNVVQTVYTNEPQQYGNLISSRISGTTSYHHFDAIGSTRQLTNAAGVTDSVIYDAWGNIVNRSGATNSALLWIGEVEYYFDVEASLVWLRARSYGPAVARWQSPDSLSFVNGDNPFPYANNRVTVRIDPSGHDEQQTPEISIAITVSTQTLKERNCGFRNEASLDWKLTLTPRPRRPGYVVQEVEVRCVAKDCIDRIQCPNASPAKATFRYWEGWFIENNRTIFDAAASKARPQMCKLYVQFGKFKFFYRDGDNGTGDLEEKWNQNESYGDGPCRTTANPLMSVGNNDGSRANEPGFWSDPKAQTGKGASRWFSFWSNCCCKPGVVTADAYPRLAQDTGE